MLNIDLHKQQLSRLLLALMSEKEIAPRLAFKGGTALYFFDDLPRFSTDLDFDLLGVTEPELAQKIRNIVAQYLTIVDEKTKRFTWFWQGSYEKGEMKIKVEINTRQYPNHYELKDFRGYSIRVMTHEDMLAHKLCAITDRKTLQNRDLYDAWWMLTHGWEASEEIVRLRTGMQLNAYWQVLLEKIRALPPRYDILSGMGEIMNTPQKDWVKAKLRSSLELELASRI